MIPKIAHFIWGSPSMSWMRFVSLASFRKLNPDWEIILHLTGDCIQTKPWNDAAVQDFFNYRGRNYFSRLSNLRLKIVNDSFILPNTLSPIHKSDILRWFLLYKFGGLYFDTDILFVKDINSWFSEISKQDLLTCFVDEYFSIGFLGSCKENYFYKLVFDTSIKLVKNQVYESAGIPLIHRILNKSTRPHPDVLRHLSERFPQYLISHQPTCLVYPFTKEQIFMETITELPKETLGIHWFAGYPISQEFNNKIDESNYCSINNTLGYFLKKVFEE